MTPHPKNADDGSASTDSSRVIATLGMHRGGTSAGMRSLACLGVDPGNDLLAGAPDQNPLGFFEDEPLLEICNRVLTQLGTSWDSPHLISGTEWREAALGGLELEAIESIRARFDGVPVWGFKNPRLARLLPFWQRVFKAVGRQDSYLIMLRNPLSVSRSLETRNSMSPRTVHLLWLIHMTDTMVNTQGRPRICVDYDALLSAPEAQLERVASALDLSRPNDDPEALESFVRDFLRKDLRTTQFSIADLELEPGLSALAERAYGLLRRWANDDTSLSARQLERGFRDIRNQLQNLAPVFTELSLLLRERDEAKEEIGGNHDRIHALQIEAVDRDQELAVKRQRIDLLEEGASLAKKELTEREATLLAENRELQNVTLKAAVLSSKLETLEEENGRERRRSEEHVRSALSERDRERAALIRLSEEHQQAIKTATKKSDDLEIRLHASKEGSTELIAKIAAQQHEMIEWLHRQTAISTAQLADACRGLRVSKTWRLVAWMQRATENLRGRKWVDGSLHLQHLINQLQSQSELRSVDVRFLASIATDVHSVVIQILGGRIFRIIHRSVGLKFLLQFERRPTGPIEILRHRVSEVAFFLQQLSHAPIDTAITPPQPVRLATKNCVDVIIPVYDAREETLRCIDSVLGSHNQTPSEIIVIDDAGHDKKLRRALEELARQGSITLLRNAANLGFPKTVNRGMALHDDRDVVILNSDTLVHGAWLDRLRKAALSDWNVATVTPFTNNGEICSYPMICQAQPMPGDDELARLDELAATVNAGLTVTLPTAVGFCMYIRRSVLTEIGDFDAARFERGYGEENEFCLRARASGYRHLLAADVFVGHEGGSSFGSAKRELIEQGLQQLRSLHPDYEGEIHRFIGSDPIRWLRQRLDVASIASDSSNAILMVSHSQGGGTHRHVVELSTHLEREGTPVFLLQPASPTHASLTRFGAPSSVNLTFDLTQEFSRLIDILRLTRIGHVHIHHLLGFHPIIRDVSRELQVQYDFTVHDYYTICPRVHLVDDRNSYCGVPDAQTCTKCIDRNGGETGFKVDVAQWRTESAELLKNARSVYTPSHDVQLRLAKLLPGVSWKMRPHPEETMNGRPSELTHGTSRTLRVAVIGAIGLHKGALTLLNCAADASKRDLPIEFHLIGFSDRDEELLATGKVRITGAYEEADLQSHLIRARCRIAFLPSVWPETFSYTLSAAIQGEVYPVAFDLGAIAERIRALDWGNLLPPNASASTINDCLLELQPPPFPRESAEKICGKSYDRYLADYYDNLEL